MLIASVARPHSSRSRTRCCAQRRTCRPPCRPPRRRVSPRCIVMIRPPRISYSAACADRLNSLTARRSLVVSHLAVPARDHAPAIRPVEDLEPLAGHRVAHLERLPDDQLLQLRIVERRGALLLQIRHRHAARSALAAPSAVGVYQIGDVHARSCSVAGTRARRRHAQLRRVVGGPARRRDLQHADVVEGVQARIELRIRPDRLQLDGADGVRVGGLLDIDRVADGGTLPVFGSGLRLPDQATS